MPFFARELLSFPGVQWEPRDLRYPSGNLLKESMILTARLLSLSLLLCASALLSACAENSNSDDNQVVPTIYYKPTLQTASATQCSSSDIQNVTSVTGKVLETLCEADYKNCVLQGSCFIVDKRGEKKSYNVHSRREGTIRFSQVNLEKCRYGFGVSNTCLDPYFSVAADLTFYKLGDVIFVPRLVGVPLPTGEVHDGFLVVRDKGGGIIGINRFDFYTGFINHKSAENIFSRLGFSDRQSRFDFRKATEFEARETRSKRNYPYLPL